MAAKKIIAVVGATGAQGGALARAILEDPSGEFAVRALTRKPESDKARALAARGAEVVQADLDDVDSLARAFAGAHGVYGVTNFWELFDPARETQQARNIAEAAKRAGVRHVVWSTLDDTRKRVPLDDDRMPTLMGRYKVPHFDAKGEADDYFRELGVPTTFFATTFYWDNLIFFGVGPKRGEDGVLRLALPMGTKRLAGIAVEDLGRLALGIFRRGDALVGQTVHAAGGFATGEEMAAKLTAALGEEVRYQDVPFPVYRSLGFPGAEDMGNMFQYYHDFEAEFCGARDLDFLRELDPQLLDFDAWLAKYGSQIPIEAAAR